MHWYRRSRLPLSALAQFRHWLDDHVLSAFAGRVLAIDTGVALRCARLHVPDRMAHGDALIAATALVHGLTVVARNTTDFKPAAVALPDPWLALAWRTRGDATVTPLSREMDTRFYPAACPRSSGHSASASTLALYSACAA